MVLTSFSLFLSYRKQKGRQSGYRHRYYYYPGAGGYLPE